VARQTFGSSGGRIRSTAARVGVARSERPVEEVVREIKAGMQRSGGENYRDRSIALHGLVCARCGREFDHTTRHLLTVHHKDGNHHNNPPDGSNWENLCVYCHDDIHSREVLGDYLDGASSDKSREIVYKDSTSTAGFNALAAKLQKALKK